jgi:hypothetical protein
MKHLKLTIAIAATGMLLGAGQAAYAVTPVAPSYTYVFTGNSDAGDPSFDGSTITINSGTDAITGWNLIDNGDMLDNNGNPVEVDFTPANSTILAESVSDADDISWTGYFYIWNGPYAPATPEFIADTFYGDSDGSGASNGGDLYDGSGLDPDGSWIPETPSVPDALNSFQLLAIALGALGASTLFFRRPTPALVRK